MRSKVKVIVGSLVILLLAGVLVSAQQKSRFYNNALLSLEYYTSALDKVIPALQPLNNAVVQLKASIEAGEAVDESLLLLAVVYQEQGKLDAAKNTYYQYLQRNSEDGWIYVLIGDIDYFCQDYQQAMEHYQKALTYGEYASAYYGIACIKNQQGLTEAAVDELVKAVELAPSFVEARIALGKGYYETQQYDLALEQFEICYLYAPRDAEVHYYLWLLYKQNGDMEKAVHSRDLAIQYNPAYAQIIADTQ